MEKIAIIGTGYVGLVTGTCFAELGNKVICVDSDIEKINSLISGEIPIYEPGLSALVKKNIKRKRLFFSSEIKKAVRFASIIFIAVGTPSDKKGAADLSAVESVSTEIARYMKSYKLVVEKSTVPVETGRWVEDTLHTFKKKKVKFDIASNPEFCEIAVKMNTSLAYFFILLFATLSITCSIFFKTSCISGTSSAFINSFFNSRSILKCLV